MIKVVIEIRGGNFQALYSTNDIEYVLIDYDNNSVEGPLKPDDICSTISEIFEDEIKDKLKELKF